MGMEGFSDKLLEDHLKLYKGYVNNSKVLLGKLRELLKDNKGNTPEYAELKRRLGWEMDGMILHEYYFENLGGDGKPDTESALYAAIIKDFGSFEKWKEDIISTGSMRGIGWAVLYYDPRTERLVNIWVNEHDTGHIAAGRPILVIDVFEHAYMTDYRLERGKYIGAFFKNIDWKTAQERYDHV
ncbi:MAG: Fe-Mn family superoxide dismutase, partial [Candidatus Omnitrophica bacterium]|nr:Fe-Mn family superoxide dismutase [Candidatus Omnitrophota bacterium]